MARLFLGVAGLAFTVGHATATIYLPLDDVTLVARSAAVITGRVVAVGSRRDGARVVTDAVVAVERTLKGATRGPTVTVTTPGGTVGETSVVVFGAPRFVRDEAVLVFLDPTAAGELRTTGLAHGLFRLEDTHDGRRLAVRAAPLAAVRDVEAFAAMAQALADPGAVVGSDFAPPDLFGGGATGEAFSFLGASPARWFEPDTNTPVRLRVANADPTLGTGVSNAVVDASLAAWTEVSSASITLERGGSTSPAASVASGACDGVSTVQFADPVDELPALDRCFGILAIGGFCTGAGTRTVNGLVFRRIAEGDLTTAKGVGECVNRRGLEEVVTHEIGHAIGLGHSSENPNETNVALREATMYFAVHLDGRGASLRTDDIAGVTAAYPIEIDPNDLDGDGVPNDDDVCPTTPNAAPVDASGCACGEAGHPACDDGLDCTGDFCSSATGECDAAPIDCSGGDPCLVGSCAETTGCASTPVAGDAAVLCIYGRPFPPLACREVRVPAALRRAHRAAARLAARGLDRGDARAIARAARRLDRARGAVERLASRRRRPLRADCAAALTALLADARARLPVPD